MRRSSLTTATSLLVLGSLGLAACSSSSPEAVDHLAYGKLTKALKASYAKGSVHVVDVTTMPATTKGAKDQVTTMTADIARDAAAETIVGSDGSETSLVLKDETIYVRSTATVLSGTLGLSPAAAASYANRWISISKTDGAYQTVAAALSIEAEVTPYVPTKSTARRGTPRKLEGTEVTVLPISGRYDATGLATPVDASAATFINVDSGLVQGGSIVVGGKSGAERKLAVFTRWGAPITVTAPSGAVAYAEVYKQ